MWFAINSHLEGHNYHCQTANPAPSPLFPPHCNVLHLIPSPPTMEERCRLTELSTARSCHNPSLTGHNTTSVSTSGDDHNLFDMNTFTSKCNLSATVCMLLVSMMMFPGQVLAFYTVTSCEMEPGVQHGGVI
ncbi:hypothetical protein KC19_10G075000 [Ceratodon purpureus]|uniref:Uncharacterized protein n=1 Tax=Ceratodon purpureus TaxID=3225 RepID=A0A8T0GPX9_CERPU|nr:hypothetical protein KC19_10G075000 [Ceratodon purpureus]